MGYSVESDGTRRYRLNSQSEVVSPPEGHDYRVDRIKSRLGFAATVRGKYFYPVDTPVDPVRALQANGFSTPAEAYYENAGEMARLGVATAVYDTRRPISLRDLRNPLLAAKDGGHHMLDIMQDTSGDGETAIVGHSMGGIVAAQIAINDGRVDYYVGDAIAGIEHKGMWRSHLKNRRRIQKGIAEPLVKMLMRDKNRWQTAYEFGSRIVFNPTQLAAQGLYLLRDPEISPLFTALNHIGVPIAVLLHEHDEFFGRDQQLEVINENPELFGTIKLVDGTNHMEPNFQPLQSAQRRVDTIYELREQKRAQKVAS